MRLFIDIDNPLASLRGVIIRKNYFGMLHVTANIPINRCPFPVLGHHPLLVSTLFQFFFQTVFILPSLVKSVTGSGTDWEDLINAKTLSILMSFFSFARSFYAIRLGRKRNITWVLIKQLKTGTGQRRAPSSPSTWYSSWWRPPLTAWAGSCCSAPGCTWSMTGSSAAPRLSSPSTPPSCCWWFSTQSSTRVANTAPQRPGQVRWITNVLLNLLFRNPAELYELGSVLQCLWLHNRLWKRRQRQKEAP